MAEEESVKSKRLAKNTGLLYLRMVFLVLVKLYTSRVTLQILGVEDFGIQNLVAGLISSLDFMKGSLSQAANRFIAFRLVEGDADATNRTFSMSLNIHALMAVVAIIIGETAGLWLVNTQLQIPEVRMFAANIVYQTSIITFVCTLLSIPYIADIVANENMKVYAYVCMLDGAIRLAIVFALPFMDGDKLIWLAILLSLISVAQLLCYYVYCRRKYAEARYKRCWLPKVFKEMGAFAGQSAFGNFALAAMLQGQTVLLNIFFGPILNAARAIGMQVISTIDGLMQSVYTAANPQITKSYAEGNRDYFEKVVLNTTKYAYAMLLLVLWPIIFEGDFILKLWLGDVPEYTGIFVRLSVVYSVSLYLTTPTLMGLQATGKIAKVQIVSGVLNLMNLVVTYALWKCIRTEPWAMYVIMIFLTLCIAGTQIRIQSQQLGIACGMFFMRALFPILRTTAVSVVLPLALWTLWSEDGWLRFLSMGILCMVCTLASVYWCMLDAEMRGKVKEKIKGLLARN